MEKEEKERLEYDINGRAFDANGFIVMKATSKWAIGADIGQSRDYSAVAIIEQVREPMDIPDSSGIRQLGPSTNYIRKIKRVPRNRVSRCPKRHRLRAKPPPGRHADLG